jgi:hypothetical protein
MSFEKEPCILEEEVKAALHQISNDKAPGVDEIPIELIKAGGDEAARVITMLCQTVWDTGHWPKDWKRSVFVPLFKKGDPKDCSNYRTIALISHTSKVLLKVIHNRMEQYVEREIPDVQAGFRKERGTRDQIANLRWIMERQREYNQELYLCFIDYQKAFDCVQYDKLWAILRQTGIPEHLIYLLKSLYLDQEAAVRTEDGCTDYFKVEKGVRQGCILSPVLFNLYAEGIMRECYLESVDEGIRIGGRNINNLRYADDTTLMDGSKSGLKKLLDRVKAASESKGLLLNVGKTKVMSSTTLDRFDVGNHEIEVVDSFTYLGSVITSGGSCEAEIKRRLALGRAAMAGLSNIWKAKNVTVQTKVRLVKALVFPVVTYGCESWTVRKREKARIDAFELWCWRRLLRVPWTEKRTNRSILDEVKPEMPLQAIVLKQKLSYFGHVMRKDSLEKSVMLGMGGGSRRRGRPRTRWLHELLETTGRSVEQLVRSTQNRHEWRSFTWQVARGRYRLDGTR